MAEQIQKIQNFLTKDSATFLRKKKYADPGTLRYSLYKQAEVNSIHLEFTYTGVDFHKIAFKNTRSCGT